MDILIAIPKKVKKVIIFFVVVIILVYIVLPKYEFTHYKLSLGSLYITKVEYKSIISGNSTYFTEGKYYKRSIPESYIKPVYSGISGGYDIILSSENGKINIYGLNGYFETHELKDNTNFEMLESNLDGVKKWKKMVSDNSGKYIHVFY